MPETRPFNSTFVFNEANRYMVFPTILEAMMFRFDLSRDGNIASYDVDIEFAKKRDFCPLAVDFRGFNNSRTPLIITTPSSSIHGKSIVEVDLNELFKYSIGVLENTLIWDRTIREFIEGLNQFQRENVAYAFNDRY